MPGFNPDNINIHDLTVEEPEKESELLFDPEKEITDDDIDAIKKHLSKFQEQMIEEEGKGGFHVIGNLLFNIMQLKIARPDVEVVLDPKVQKLIDNEKHGEDDLVKLKVIEPEKVHVDDELLVRLENRIQKRRSLVGFREWSGYLGDAYRAKILGLDQSKLLWDAKAKKGCQEYLDEEKKKSQTSAGFLGNFMYGAMEMKVIDPSIDSGIDEHLWEMMSEHIEENKRNGSWGNFTHDAMTMTILAAEEVYVPAGGGLVVNMRKPSLEENGSMDIPEQRKF